MTRTISTLALLSMFAAAPALVGCDKTVAEKKTTETNRDGTVTTEKQKTTQHPDGTVTKTESEVRK